MAVSTGASSWGTCRVYGTWRNYDGTNKEGTVDVRIPNEVRNATDDVIIPAGMFIKGMDLNTAANSTSFDQGLPANDDEDNAPVDWGKVEITVKFKDGSDTEKYVIDTPVDGAVNLRTVINPTKVPSQKAMLVRGVPGGVAGLNGAGEVIDADGDPVTGGGSASWSTLSGKPDVIAAGDTKADARDAIGALDSTDLNGYVQDSSSKLLPSGGSSGQILSKKTGGDYDTEWTDAPSGGAVDSVNSKTGAVTLDASDVDARADTWKPSWPTDISGAPSLGSAASKDTTAFATAAQGDLADSAVQPADLADVATSGAYGDLSGTPTIPSQASDVDAVPDTRKVNGKALSSDVTLDASDVSARSDSWTPGYADLPAGSTLTVLSASGSWPARPTSRTDVYVDWIDADELGTDPSGMKDGDRVFDIS